MKKREANTRGEVGALGAEGRDEYQEQLFQAAVRIAASMTSGNSTTLSISNINTMKEKIAGTAIALAKEVLRQVIEEG